MAFPLPQLPRIPRPGDPPGPGRNVPPPGTGDPDLPATTGGFGPPGPARAATPQAMPAHMSPLSRLVFRDMRPGQPNTPRGQLAHLANMYVRQAAHGRAVPTALPGVQAPHQAALERLEGLGQQRAALTAGPARHAVRQSIRGLLRQPGV